MCTIFPEPVDALGFTPIGWDAPYEVIHHDNLQSVLGLSGHDGTVLQTISYDPFGNILSTTGTANNNQLHYTGRETDPDTGFIYMRNRLRDPITGIFLSEDPIGIKGGLNLYQYCRQNPINCNDPYGLQYVDVNLTLGAGWGGTIGLQYDPERGLYVYGGFGYVIGAGASATYHPNPNAHPTTGLSTVATVTYGLGPAVSGSGTYDSSGGNYDYAIGPGLGLTGSVIGMYTAQVYPLTTNAPALNSETNPNNASGQFNFLNGYVNPLTAPASNTGAGFTPDYTLMQGEVNAANAAANNAAAVSNNAVAVVVFRIKAVQLAAF